MQKFILFIFLITAPAILFAQSKKEEEKSKKEKTEEIEKPDISIELTSKDSLDDVAVKVKKNTFYGERTKSRWAVTDVQGRDQLEEFYTLKEAVEVDAYVPIVYVYDPNKRQIANANTREGLVENVLHGPYKRLINDKLVEEGMYFHGVKHERWLNLTRDQTLNDKEHYNKGWYRDSEITYYDPDEKTKIKEVIPIRYGKKEGTYYYFYENGRVAVRGFYEFDKKIGIWTEYHNTTRVIAKREVQFPPDAYQKRFRTYVRKEWDRFANQLYESPKIK
ncbi:toxin-antitoxin system YwqK family antitoxin [Roseivirga echinicomitans]